MVNYLSKAILLHGTMPTDRRGMGKAITINVSTGMKVYTAVSRVAHWERGVLDAT